MAALRIALSLIVVLCSNQAPQLLDGRGDADNAMQIISLVRDP
jgi:hypothetical protein